MVRWILYSWICCWFLVVMTESTIPNNARIERLKDLLYRQSGWYQEFFKEDKDEPEDVISPSKKEIPSIISPKEVEMPQGYIDTITNIDRDIEPFNMSVVQRIEGGDLVLKARDPARYTNPISGAVGPYQIKPDLHKDIGALKWYGATNLDKDISKMSIGEQRAHSNKYLKALLGRYSDKLSGTKTWKKKGYDPKLNLQYDDFGADAGKHWDKGGIDYTPRHDVKGARAAALASYNFGHNNIDKIMDNPKLKLTDKTIKSFGDLGTEAKMEEVRGYLGKYVAEGDLTKQEVLDAFPEMKGHIDKYVTGWHDVNKRRQRR